MTIDEQKELNLLRVEHKKLVDQRKKYTLRRLVKVSLLEQKAIAKGIIVTDIEIDKEIARRASLKK